MYASSSAAAPCQDIGLQRLRSKGMLVEVDANALRFSEPEASDFLTRRRGMALSRAQVSHLLGRTLEGWARGLVAGLAGPGTAR